MTDWERSPRGAGNPAYCYQWCFGAPPSPVVACLWFDEVHENSRGRAQVEVVLRHGSELSSRQKSRADRLLQALVAAHNASQPIRAIISAGPLPPSGQSHGGKRSVTHRALDSEPWTVHVADPETGRCVLLRGLDFVDQFSTSVPESELKVPVRRTVVTETLVRDPRLREQVLRRAGGICEFCGAAGFVTASGRVYLETHHIEPLSEGGSDAESNMIALCPNDHRRAHHGLDREELAETFKARVTQRVPGSGDTQ